MKDLAIARRDLLKRLGLGAACLPLLRSRARAALPARRRLVIVQMSQGYRQAFWRPRDGSLVDQTLPSTVEPLEPWKSDLVFLPGLTNPGIGIDSRDAYRLMFYGRGASGAPGARQPDGPTLDQIVGAALPRAPGGRPSLNLGVMIERPGIPTRAGENCCFWRTAGQPIQPLGDPYAVYRDLFTPGAGDTAAIKRLILRRKSILDYVGSNLDELGQRSGQPDRREIERHQQAIRDLERQLEAASESAGCGGAPPSPMLDLNTDRNYPPILGLHMKAMVAALRCGLTSVATLQLSDAAAATVDLNAFLALQARAGRITWRDVGHNPSIDSVDRKRVVERWFMERIAELLQQLREVVEDGVPLLHNTIVLIGNPMEDGPTSDLQRSPWMLAGNGGGALATGQCVGGAGHSGASVMAAICETLGVSQHPFGEAMPQLKKI